MEISVKTDRVEVTVRIHASSWVTMHRDFSSCQEAIAVFRELFEEKLRDALKTLLFSIDTALDTPHNGLVRVESLGLGILKAKLDSDAFDKLTR